MLDGAGAAGGGVTYTVLGAGAGATAGGGELIEHPAASRARAATAAARLMTGSIETSPD
ncbi:MAG: hypothetical protein JOY70_11250 [Acidisphaera sp.]|nr:hypothetical protein [Acidisphaera sp.]